LTALAHPSERHTTMAAAARTLSQPPDSRPAYPAVIQSKSAELKSPPNRLIFVTPAADIRRAAVAAADSHGRVPRPAPAPSADSAPRAPAPAAAADSLLAATQPRTVAAWANVREAPGTESAVVKVLKPGDQVNVVREHGGWWAVYHEGRRIGYVSRSLLA